MNKPELEQSKFQKYCGNISIISFWTWLATILVFALFILSFGMGSQSSNLGVWFLLDILLGVIAFITAIISNEIAKVRTTEETKSFYGALKIWFVILLAFPAVVYASFGQNKINDPIPTSVTPNSQSTPQPTPTPKPKIVNVQPKPPQITCTGPDHKEFQTSEAECIKFRTSWGLSPSNTPRPTQTPQRTNNTVTNTNTIPTSTYTPTVYPVCTVYYPTINFKSTYYYMTAEECAEANKNATANVPTPTPTPIVDIAALISQCKANVDAKYYPIFQRCNSYDAATHQFCYETSTNSKNAEYAACNSIGN